MSNQTAGNNTFFLIYAVVLLALVLIGFAPTFYLRFLFDNPVPSPGYAYVHGAILTGWYVLVVVQASLISKNDPALHHRLGYFGAFFGILVIGGGLLATYARIPHIINMEVTFETDFAYVLAIEGGMDPEQAFQDVTEFGVPFIVALSPVTWSNTISVLNFAIFFCSALYFRRRPDFHRRFILIASLAYLGPALSRISRLPYLGGEGGPFNVVVLLTLVGALIAYGLISIRKIHKATLAGIGVTIILSIIGLNLGRSQFGQDFMRSFG